VTQSPQLDPRTAALTTYLSSARLFPYLSATDQNTKAALRLYQWNIDLSGAAYEALHMFEVVLRNALDRQLGPWNATQIDPRTGVAHSSDWLMDPSRLLKRLTRSDIDKANDRARQALRRYKRVPGHADVLAHLSLGTWRYLLPDRDAGRQLLWAQALAAAFPHLTAAPHDLTASVSGIHKLRNRVAHLEPLLRTHSVAQEVTMMRRVLSYIDPYAEQWFTSRQRVTSVIKQRP